MDLLIFCTVFILQFVGHRIGDYLFQTNDQAINKAKDGVYRVRHCISYSLTVASMILFVFEWDKAVIVFGLTFLEHMWIDSRTPVIKWKNFIERKLAKNNDFEVDSLPFFVLIEIDHSIHILRIFIISLLFGYGIL